MIKKDIVKIVAESAGINEAKADIVVEKVISAMKSAIVNGEDIHIRGFGVLEPVTRKGKVAHNFQTGERVIVPPKKSVKFIKSRNFNI